jgi:hypothetical protein
LGREEAAGARAPAAGRQEGQIRRCKQLASAITLGRQPKAQPCCTTLLQEVLKEVKKLAVILKEQPENTK